MRELIANREAYSIFKGVFESQNLLVGAHILSRRSGRAQPQQPYTLNQRPDAVVREQKPRLL